MPVTGEGRIDWPDDILTVGSPDRSQRAVRAEVRWH